MIKLFISWIESPYFVPSALIGVMIITAIIFLYTEFDRKGR